MKQTFKERKWHNLVLYIVCVLVCVKFFWDIRGIFLTTHDDIIYYMHVRLGDVLDKGINDAKSYGRFYFIYSEFIYSIPYIFNSKIWVKLVEYFAILFSVSGMCKLVHEHIDRRLTYIVFILFFAFAQIDYQHNVFVSYVFHHQIGVGFIFFSLSSFISYLKNKEVKNLIFSSVLFSIPLFLYEAYICYIVSYFLIALFFSWNRIDSLKTALIEFLGILKIMKYHIVACGAFLIAYLGFRILYPTTYIGTAIYVSSIESMLNTIVSFGLGLAPLRVWFECYRQWDIIEMISQTDMVSLTISIIVAGGVVLLTRKVKKIRFIQFILITTVSVLSVFLPCIPYGLTSQYSGWVSTGNVYGFVPSYFGFFFIVIIFAIVPAYIYQKIPHVVKNVYLSLLFLGVFITSIITNETNKQVAEGFSQTWQRYESFDIVVSSEEFLKIPSGSMVYVPDYSGIHYNLDNNEMYLKIYSDKDIQLENDYTKLNFENPVYTIRYDADCKVMMLAKINSDFIADSFNLYSLEEAIGNVTFRSRENIVQLKSDDAILFVDEVVYLDDMDFAKTKKKNKK